jgi:colanic acid/amylovoran biosynthesis glycosyltransferase
MPPKIAYIMTRFPHLPETFILREMTALKKQGWAVVLYPLILQQQTVIHAEAKPWLSRARLLPFISFDVIKANYRIFREEPYHYSKLWGQVVRENLSYPKFLIRAMALFPKTVYAARLMQQEGITHIHAHYATYPALAAWLIHQLTGISYSVTVHAHDIFVRTEMLGTKLRAATFIAAISEYNREHLVRVVGSWVREKTHIIHCGIVPDYYEPQTSMSEPKERFEIISIGSLQPYKGHPYLIKACALLRDQGVPLRCRIIGGGEERANLERLIREAQLEGLVELLGPQPQEVVARLLPTAHCYVQPSIITPAGKMEGIPVALMEALACELPVVATEISGIPELVQPDKTGYLVPPADVSALAKAISAVHNDPKRVAKMARAGRALVLKEFELSANVRQLAYLFNKQLHLHDEKTAQQI